MGNENSTEDKREKIHKLFVVIWRLIEFFFNVYFALFDVNAAVVKSNSTSKSADNKRLVCKILLWKL